MSLSLYDLSVLRSYCMLKNKLKRYPTKHEFMACWGISSTAANKFLKRLITHGFFVGFPFDESVNATTLKIYTHRKELVRTKFIGFKLLEAGLWMPR